MRPEPRTSRFGIFCGVSALLLLSFAGLRSDPVPSPVEEDERPRAAAETPSWLQRIPGAEDVDRPRAQASGSAQETFRSDQVMVRTRPDTSLYDLAAAHGTAVVRAAGPSGFGALSVPRGVSAADFLHTLAADERIDRSAPMGRLRGADNDDDDDGGGGHSGAGAIEQWHLDACDVPTTSGDLSPWVVAVLDTGVAYEDYGASVAAPSLAGLDIVAPYDFVNDDSHANDDHQHGTHIASLIASSGSVIQGVAPGASLMPVKVLDEDNQGTELSLIDGIYWAVDNGAHVINMSLSFSQGYVPSAALQEALAYAADSGVVLVAAAGNDAQESATWPAASPRVISVVAGRLKTGSGKGAWSVERIRPSDYTNWGSGVDVTSPGGDLERDLNNDGYGDGLLAETIGRGDPSVIEHWFYAGSSQAAALVSGAAVQLLAAGASPEAVPYAIQLGATLTPPSNATRFSKGGGAGALSVGNALASWQSVGAGLAPETGYHVAMMPYLESQGSEVRPVARVVVVDDDGALVTGGEVLGTLWDGASSQMVTCSLSSSGSCLLTGDYQIAPDAAAWAFSVDGYEVADMVHRVGKAMFATDGGEILLTAIGDEDDLDDSVLAIYWGEATDASLGPIAESYATVDMGTGLASSPLGVLFTPGAIADHSDISSFDVDLDGTGLASSPLGLATVQLIRFTGTGLASSPLGFSGLRLVAIDGVGLASSPLGFHPQHMLAPSVGTGLASSPLGFSGNPLLLGPQLAVGVSVSGTRFGELLDGEGMRTEEDYEAASQLVGSGVVSVGWTTSVTSGSAAGSMDLDGAFYPTEGAGEDSGCAITVDKAEYSGGNVKVWATVDGEPASVELYADGEHVATMTWKADQQQYRKSKSWPSQPETFLIDAGCGSVTASP